MGELGGDAVAMHREIGEYAKRSGVHSLLACGELCMACVEAFGEGAVHFEDKAAISAALAELVDKETVVLVKGSRFMRMEQIIEQLFNDDAQQQEVG
jgi:UDP-N-acetylmuramyl pentapeptide synthase